MFCDSCGTQVQPGQAICSKCAKPLTGYFQQANRMERHLHLLGIFWIAYSIIHALGGAVLVIIANTIFNPMRHFEIGAPSFLHPLLSFIGVLLLTKGIVGVVAGYGLMQRAPWAWITTVVLAFISMLNVPFGTAIGIYTVWVLLSPGADIQYRNLGRPVSV